VRVRTQGRQQHSAKERSCELAEEDGRQGATGDGRKEGRTDVDGSKDHGKKEGQKKEGRKVQRKEGRAEKEGRKVQRKDAAALPFCTTLPTNRQDHACSVAPPVRHGNQDRGLSRKVGSSVPFPGSMMPQRAVNGGIWRAAFKKLSKLPCARARRRGPGSRRLVARNADRAMLPHHWR